MRTLNNLCLQIVAVCLLLGLWTLHAYSQNPITAADFSFNQWNYYDLQIPYREAVITNDDNLVGPALVIYLHGGPKRGNDNLRQMQEPAIYTIADFLQRNKVNAIIIVPQCPDSLTWGVGTNEVVKALADKYIAENKVDTTRIYLLGGSMGGTGTWLMASAYPHFFAAIMPVAGNPETANAETVAETPVYTVMGSDDHLMTIPRVSQFVEQIKKLGDEAFIDTENGWSHVKTCTDSYTDERLEWIFGHKL